MKNEFIVTSGRGLEVQDSSLVKYGAMSTYGAMGALWGIGGPGW